MSPTAHALSVIQAQRAQALAVGWGAVHHQETT